MDELDDFLELCKYFSVNCFCSLSESQKKLFLKLFNEYGGDGVSLIEINSIDELLIAMKMKKPILNTLNDFENVLNGRKYSENIDNVELFQNHRVHTFRINLSAYFDEYFQTNNNNNNNLSEKKKKKIKNKGECKFCYRDAVHIIQPKQKRAADEELLIYAVCEYHLSTSSSSSSS